MTASHDAVSLSRMLIDLHRDFPAWCFSVQYRGGEPHVEAVRAASAGLVCVITDDTAELRRELNRAAA
jgi:hypothetical protein